MHSSDLPLYDNAAKVGFGLWNSRGLSYALEALTLLVGFRVFLKWRGGRMIGTLIFVLAMVVLQGLLYYGPTPQSVNGAAAGALVVYLLLTAVIWWLQDRRRQPEPA